MIESQRHSYHLVDPSPWPISGSLGALATTVGGVMYMHPFQGGATLLSLGLIFILYTMFVWWRDVLRESTLEGHHTKVVQLGLRYGFIPFIVSEVMFLFAFFRASSHSSLAPTVEIGGIWPPKGIGVLDPREIPFLNTPILLSSGAAVTWAHHAILAGKEKRAVYALVATVSLALVFTGFQGMEYFQAPFTISDSIYGSTFFLANIFYVLANLALVSGLMVSRLVHSILFTALVFLDTNIILGFFFNLPLFRRTPKAVQILLFSIFRIIFPIILARITVSLGYLFLDELSQAVAQFYSSTSGGMSGGSLTPPSGPSYNWLISSFAIEGESSHGERGGSPAWSAEFPALRMATPEFQEMRAVLEAPVLGEQHPPLENRAPNRNIMELQNDRALCISYRNALIKQEEIIVVMTHLVETLGINIDDPSDIRNGVDIFFTDLMEKESKYRNTRMNFILKSLVADGTNSRFFLQILKAITDLA